ncbi:MAG: sigma-70 family RNA polymerase sigma factor [Propionicimonas sp.]|uniref:RNA polymerase sigma factor n=1 Tax=Propionicimonas sp. TaxID=1955623 RepID=UPI002B1ED7E6|nr:sigma-70 family RNA polymerase sigma factor [Propionicimonas sp.]MEA4945099.1 sigma-70 family RNA polymerase sigma factor [Propionicimonas sp.]MEA5055358.1 sigma-70 family RNA polymerase sigma factor [Propionicimonas sp.]
MSAPDRSRPEHDPAGLSDLPAAPVDATRWELAAALFRRWQGGDSRAVDDLVRLLTPTLWQVARSYGLDRELAEDVVQSTWLALVHSRDAITEPQAVSSWLITTARREAWRVGRLQRRADVSETEHLEPHLATSPSAEQVAGQTSTATQLWTAVNQLTERCQRLLRVVAFEDRPDYARLATDLEMPVGSIGPTRQRCLAKLKTLLAEGEPDGW